VVAVAIETKCRYRYGGQAVVHCDDPKQGMSNQRHPRMESRTVLASVPVVGNGDPKTFEYDFGYYCWSYHLDDDQDRSPLQTMMKSYWMDGMESMSS
jgi:hypothetical protein